MNPLQKDVIKEISNIGTGHAATALSQLLGRRIDMAVPLVESIPLEEVCEHFGAPEEPICAVLTRCEDNFPCNIVFLMPEEHSARMGDLLLQRISIPCDPDHIEEIRESALAEAGNIVLGAFMNALGDMMHAFMPLSVPAVAHDMLGALMDVLVGIYGISGDMALVVNTPLSFPDDCDDFTGRVMLIPDPGALDSLFVQLGVA